MTPEFTHPHPSEIIFAEIVFRRLSVEDVCRSINPEDPNFAAHQLRIYYKAGPGNTNCRMGKELSEGLGKALSVSPDFFLNLEKGWLRSKGVFE